MDERPAPLATAIDDAIAALGKSVRRELRRTMLGLVSSIVAAVLLLVVALGLIVAGIIRLVDALAHACGQWFGNQVLGDAMVGLLLLAVPLVGFLIVRLRTT